MMKYNKEPIFIVGVPRSGTTLLRVLLDSHSKIACGPESPWLARAPLSIKNLYTFMSADKFGYVRNYGISKNDFKQQVAELINNLFMKYASIHGKTRWAEKTPDHSLEIPFLSDLFPEANFIHIIRDGRDVACSTSILSDERIAISKWHSENILLDEDKVVANTIQNAALRWKIWTEKIDQSLKHLRYINIKYENLISSPDQELQKVLNFIGENYEPAMLNFKKLHHDYAVWEWGSRDVKEAHGISTNSLQRWKKELSHTIVRELEAAIGMTLLHYGYTLS
jgi:protein-tyrosine sulfotransferase